MNVTLSVSICKRFSTARAIAAHFDDSVKKVLSARPLVFPLMHLVEADGMPFEAWQVDPHA